MSLKESWTYLGTSLSWMMCDCVVNVQGQTGPCVNVHWVKGQTGPCSKLNAYKRGTGDKLSSQTNPLPPHVGIICEGKGTFCVHPSEMCSSLLEVLSS